MLTVDTYVGITSLMIACFSFGYMLGKMSIKK